MTIQELIAKLSEYPLDAIVIIRRDDGEREYIDNISETISCTHIYRTNQVIVIIDTSN